MKENAGINPQARREGLVIQELPDEVLVYDRERDKAHCLNQTAALVWGYCDGKTTVSTMARHLERDLSADVVDEKIVWYALDQLSKDHLLDDGFVAPTMLSGMSRRQMVRVMGIAAVIAIPLVTSIIAPTPAQAATGSPTGAPCSSPAECLSFSCSTGPASCTPAQTAGLCC